MKFFSLMIAVLTIFSFSCSKMGGDSKVALKNTVDSVSYTIGANIAANMARGNVDSILNREALIKGLTDGLDKKTLAIPAEAGNQVVERFFQAEQEKQMEKQYGEYRKKNEQFLIDNKAKAGVITLPSGVQYEILKAGTGVKPTLTDKVSVHYKGTMIDGVTFDSSFDRGKPAEFDVSGVIKGWTEVLMLMPVGSKWKVCIPQELAYGSNPHPSSGIKPYSTLIFEMELMSIVKPEQAKK